MSDTDQTEDEQVRRDFAAALFGRTEPNEPDEQPKLPIPNHVPREGSNPQPSNNDQDMREYVRNLFDGVTN